MPTYVCQVDVEDAEVQNPQEFVSVWGTVREDVADLGGAVNETYAVFGDYDFLVVFEVADEGTAFQVTQVIERHGLDTATMQAIPIDELGELVEDM